MQRGAVLAELPHVAQDSNAAPAGAGMLAAQHAEAGAHRRRLAIIAVIDQQGRSTVEHEADAPAAPGARTKFR